MKDVVSPIAIPILGSIRKDVSEAAARWLRSSIRRIETRRDYDLLVLQHDALEQQKQVIAIAAQEADVLAREAYFDAINAARRLSAQERKAALDAAKRG